MSHPSPFPLLLALEAESGRPSPTETVDEDVRDHARLLVSLRRRLLEAEPCPPAVLRRVQGLFRAREAAPGLLRLVFDSWRSTQPALRGPGAARSLRYEGEDGAVDLRLLPEAGGRALLQVAVEPARQGFTVAIESEGGKTSRPVRLDESGAAEIRLPRRASSFAVVVREGKRSLLRTPSVPQV